MNQAIMSVLPGIVLGTAPSLVQLMYTVSHHSCVLSQCNGALKRSHYQCVLENLQFLVNKRGADEIAEY